MEDKKKDMKLGERGSERRKGLKLYATMDARVLTVHICVLS